MPVHNFIMCHNNLAHVLPVYLANQANVHEAWINVICGFCLFVGADGFGALEALKSSSQGNSPCTTVLQAAMMVPQLSTFVTTAQVSLSALLTVMLHLLVTASDNSIEVSDLLFCTCQTCIL